MAKTSDAAQKGAPPSAAENDVHDLFVRDLLDEVGSEFKTFSRADTDVADAATTGDADTTDKTDASKIASAGVKPTAPDRSPTRFGDERAPALPPGFPQANLFDFISGANGEGIQFTERVRHGLLPPLKARDGFASLTGNLNLPGLDVSGQTRKPQDGLRAQMDAYRSPFGKKDLSYLDPLEQVRFKREAAQAKPDVAKPEPAKPAAQPDVVKPETAKPAAQPEVAKPDSLTPESVTPATYTEVKPEPKPASESRLELEAKPEPDVKPESTREVAPPPRLVPVTSVDGKRIYERTESGDWQIKDKGGSIVSEHGDLPGKKIKNVEAQPDGTVKITTEGGLILRETKEGGRSIYPDEAAFKANHPSELVDRLKDIVWDGDKIKSFRSVTKKADWYQIADDIWANAPNATAGWNGHIEIDGKTGVFARTSLNGPERGQRDESRPNSINESYKPDGSMSFEVPYPDKTKVTFKFKEGFSGGKEVLKNPEEIRLVENSGSETVWTKTAANEYTSAGGTKWKTEVEVKKDGTYSYKDLDGKERAVRTMSGHQEKENLAEKTLVEKENGKVTRVKSGDSEVQIVYAADGTTSEIRHVNKNLKLTRGTDGKFTDGAIDSTKPFAKLEKFELDVYTHNELDAFQKIRLIDNVTQFRQMSKFSSTEKEKVFKEADRLLHGRTDSVMNAAEKAKYADQLFWHIVNDKHNDQGSNSTCSVTALRGIALKEKPSVVAKLAADFANDGQFETLDGTIIKPKLDSVRVREGSPEDTFPPKPGSRSALGKLWDVCAVNISMQRDTKDPMGTICAKGTMCYEEVAPTSRSDSGARLIRNNADGSQYVLYSSKNGSATPYDSPRVGFPSRIADMWNQLTGDKLTDRFIVHDNRWVDDQTVFDNLVGAKQKSIQDLEAMLMKNNLPKVTQGNTGVLEYRYRQQVAINEGKDPNAVVKPSGGEHLFLVTGYDAASKTVAVDNSWNPLYDVQTKAEAAAQGKDLKKTVFISLNDLYEVISSTSSGDGSTFVWYHR